MHKFLFHSCTFVLLAVCHPAKANTTLLLMNATLSSADTDTTYTFKPPDGWVKFEKDPITRSFVSLPKPANFALAIGGDVLLADIGLRMRRSPRWYRHFWWAPQLAVAAGNAWGVTNNIELQRSR